MRTALEGAGLLLERQVVKKPHHRQLRDSSNIAEMQNSLDLTSSPML